VKEVLLKKNKKFFYCLVSKDIFLAQSKETFFNFFFKSPKHCGSYYTYSISDTIASKKIFLFTCDISVARGIHFSGEEKGSFPNNT